METFNIEDVSDNPFEQFRNWYQPIENEGLENSNAVALSTATAAGKVSSRIILLKGFSENGFLFFTNYNSKKGEQLRENNHSALLFYWPRYKRQVRIEGVVSRASTEESDIYFNARSRSRKFNAIVSPQSKEIHNIDELLADMGNREVQYRGTDPPRPANWGGYRLTPDLFEFWQEGKERFHTRIEYRISNNNWLKRVLAP